MDTSGHPATSSLSLFFLSLLQPQHPCLPVSMKLFHNDCSTAFTIQPACSNQSGGVLTPRQFPMGAKWPLWICRAPLRKFPRFTHNSSLSPFASPVIRPEHRTSCPELLVRSCFPPTPPREAFASSLALRSLHFIKGLIIRL